MPWLLMYTATPRDLILPEVVDNGSQLGIGTIINPEEVKEGCVHLVCQVTRLQATALLAEGKA